MNFMAWSLQAEELNETLPDAFGKTKYGHDAYESYFMNLCQNITLNVNLSRTVWLILYDVWILTSHDFVSYITVKFGNFWTNSQIEIISSSSIT